MLRVNLCLGGGKMDKRKMVEMIYSNEVLTKLFSEGGPRGRFRNTVLEN